VPNFVDLEVYRRENQPCHRAQFTDDGEKIIMHISNFRPVKRVEDVVRIFARVAAKVPARLLMIGDGPDRGRVQQLAEELDVGRRVIFLGKQESVAELLACADLFLLPSETESFGLVALEAMACGVPVVASRVGGVPEVVPNGRAGWLCEVGDIEGMAGHSVDLLSDAVAWKRASAAARAAAEQFSAARVVPQYEACYEEVVGQ
jgi:N-acetyl-alpha-D-glucosaminyl L-malate synthase BshA